MTFDPRHYHELQALYVNIDICPYRVGLKFDLALICLNLNPYSTCILTLDLQFSTLSLSLLESWFWIIHLNRNPVLFSTSLSHLTLNPKANLKLHPDPPATNLIPNPVPKPRIGNWVSGWWREGVEFADPQPYRHRRLRHSQAVSQKVSFIKDLGIAGLCSTSVPTDFKVK